MGATLGSVNPINNPAVNPNYPLSPEWSANTARFRHVVEAWCGAAFDEAKDEMWLGLGGGHTDYAGNEILACDFWSDSPSWRLVRKPSGAIGNLLTTNDHQEATGVYSDGRPRATHTYNKWCHVPGVGPVLMAHGATSWSATTGKRWAVFVDPVSGEHSFTVEPTSFETFRTDGAGSCFDPLRKAIWLIGRGNMKMVRYDIPALGGAHAGTYTTVGLMEVNLSDHSMCYMPAQDCLLVASSDDGNAVSQWRVFDCATGIWHRPTFNGSLPSDPHWQGLTQMRWVPALGSACGWNNATQTTLIAKVTPGANPRTDAWTISALPVSPANAVTPSPRTAQHTYGRFAYSPLLGGFLVFNSVDGPTYFYKL
jgi:hypothetical protein